MPPVTPIWGSCAGNAVTSFGRRSAGTLAKNNRSEFQLKLGTWPDRELQSQYALSPDDFRWVLAKKLDYEDTDEDHSEELQLLLLEFLDEHPEAKPMKPGSLKV